MDRSRRLKIFFMSIRIFRASNTFLPANASLHWLNNVSCLVLSMNWWCDTTVGTVSFFKGWTEVPIFFEDAAIGPLLLECRLLLHNSKYHLATACLILDFWIVQELRRLSLFYLIQIVRQFRIIGCKLQAALHSTLLNYNPLVIGRTDKTKQLILIKPDANWH